MKILPKITIKPINMHILAQKVNCELNQNYKLYTNNTISYYTIRKKQRAQIGTVQAKEKIRIS